MFMDLMPFKELIREQAGISIRDEGLNILHNHLRHSLAQKKFASTEEYLEILRGDTQAFNRLITLINR